MDRSTRVASSAIFRSGAEGPRLNWACFNATQPLAGYILAQLTPTIPNDASNIYNYAIDARQVSYALGDEQADDHRDSWTVSESRERFTLFTNG